MNIGKINRNSYILNALLTENNILKKKVGQSKKKDSYINNLEAEQRLNQMAIKKVIKENNNLLEQIKTLKNDLNNKNKDIAELNSKLDNEFKKISVLEIENLQLKEKVITSNDKNNEYDILSEKKDNKKIIN